MSALRRCALRVAAAAAIALVVAIVGTAAATAQPRSPSQQAECRDLWRAQYQMPDEVPTADELGLYGYPTSEMQGVADIYLVRYCRQASGTWRKVEDKFPYEDPDLCVHIFTHGNSTPPDEIVPLADIDRVGTIEPRGAAANPNDGVTQFQQFCKNGERWQRSNAPADGGRPQGSYEEWSQECLTILPHMQLPSTLDVHPTLRGSTDFRPQYVDVRDLKTYCLPRGKDPQSGPWHLVEDYPLRDIVGEDMQRRLEEPDEGLCVVVVDPLFPGELPEEVLPPGSPADYGGIVEEDYYDDQGYGDTVPEKSLYCWVNGAWRRGDILSQGCARLADPGILNRPGRDLLPDDCWGAFPTANYDIGYHGGAWDHITSKLTGWWTDTFFSLGKGATNVALWAVDWAYDFDIDDFKTFALNIGDNYRVNLTENAGFQLVEITFFLLFGWAAFMILRGRFGLAGGEILMSVVLMVLAGVLMANRGHYLSFIDKVMDDSSVDLLLAGQGHDPAKPGTDRELDKVIGDVQGQIHKAFVEDPYDYLNWGSLLSGRCAEARNHILGRGPWSDSDVPRQVMDAAGCDAEVDFNAKPTGTRMLASLLSMLASGLVAVALLGVAITVVVAKFCTLLLFGVAPFAVVTAGMPAGLRRLWWVWVMALAQALLAVVGMAMVLSLLLLTVDELLKGVEDLGLVQRFATVLLAVLVLNMLRRRLLVAGQSSAGRFADNLTNFRLGGDWRWAGPSGSQGLPLPGVESGVGRTAAGAIGGIARTGLITTAVVGGAVATGYGRYRTGRIGLRNLRKMERYREAAGHVHGQPLPFNRRRWSSRKRPGPPPRPQVPQGRRRTSSPRLTTPLVRNRSQQPPRSTRSKPPPATRPSPSTTRTRPPTPARPVTPQPRPPRRSWPPASQGTPGGRPSASAKPKPSPAQKPTWSAASAPRRRLPQPNWQPPVRKVSRLTPRPKPPKGS